MARRSRSKESIKVDLSGVESGFKAISEGVHPVVVASTQMKESSKGNPYIEIVFEITSGDSKGQKLFHNCSLQPQALFNLKSVLEALGFTIPGKAFDLDISQLVGLSCSVEVTHEVYEGKKRARIVEFISSEDSDEEADIEETLEDLSLEELKELALALGMKKIKVKKMDEDDLIEAILEEDDEDIEEALEEILDDEEEEEDEEELDEDDDEEEEDDDEMDYEEMSLKELKAEAKERGIKVTKGMKKEDLIEALEEDDEE